MTRQQVKTKSVQCYLCLQPWMDRNHLHYNLPSSLALQDDSMCQNNRAAHDHSTCMRYAYPVVKQVLVFVDKMSS